MSNINTSGKQPCGIYIYRRLKTPISQENSWISLFYNVSLLTQADFISQHRLGNLHRSGIYSAQRRPQEPQTSIFWVNFWTALLSSVGVISSRESGQSVFDRPWDWICNLESGYWSQGLISPWSPNIVSLGFSFQRDSSVFTKQLPPHQPQLFLINQQVF